MSTPSKESIGYMKSLDGIRAIAIIGVFIYHISPSALKGGFMGVDVFFILSGFLITSILLNDFKGGNFSFKEFYLRRIQRLLPNVLITVLVVQVIWITFLPVSTALTTGWHGFWTILNASNFYVWMNLGDYWGTSAAWSPLTHTWSLGIEEQFYLIYPCLLLVLLRFQPTRIKFWLITLIVLSFVTCLYGSYKFPDLTFYLLPTRIWELLLGALTAVYRNQLSVNKVELSKTQNNLGGMMGWVGILMIGVSFLVIGSKYAFPGWVSLFPTIGTVLLILSVVEVETKLSTWLSSPFLVRVGKLSYSLYLWHWPLIVFGKLQANLLGIPKSLGAVAGGVASIFFAWITYEIIEQPLRNRGPGRMTRIWIILGGFILVLCSSYTVASRPRVADPAGLFEKPVFSGKLYDAGWLCSEDFSNSLRFYDVEFPPEDKCIKNSWRTGGVIHSYGSGQPKVVVVGSSHALMYSNIIDSICKQSGISVSFLSLGGQPAFIETQSNKSYRLTQKEAKEFDGLRKKFIQEWRPDAIIVIDRWDTQCDSPDDLEKKLRSFLVEFSPLAGRIFFVSQVPAHRGGDQVNFRELVNYRLNNQKTLPLLYPDSKDMLRKQLSKRAENVMADFKNFEVLRVDKLFYKNDGSILYSSGRDFFYTDDDHLSEAGSEISRPIFQKAIMGAKFGGVVPENK
jgi:peptidoglycan/LPS O-acetylase OafA/YrhL